MPSLYRNPSLIRYGNFIFRYREKAFPIGLVVLLLAFPPHYKPGFDAADLWIDVAVLLLALTGEALRVLTVGLEYIKRGGLNKRVYAERLVTEGVFAHCRNPLYVGNVMMAFALLGIPNRPEFLLVGGVFVVLTYVAIVAAEEQYLHATFGDAYAAYCREANRWLPNFRGLRGTLQGTRFNWRRVLLKETSSFYGWIVAAFLLDGIENRFDPAALQRPDFAMFCGLFVVATLGFLTIRAMKKLRWLQLP